MSSEIYVQREGPADEHGETTMVSFKRAILPEILGPHALAHDGCITGAEFGPQDWGTIYGAEEEDITHLSFEGGGEQFMQMIWDVAERTLSYIFWIEGPPNLAVTSEAALAETSPGIIKAIGPAHIVRNGRELDQCIFGEIDSG